MNEIKEKYSLTAASSLIVGTIIGSGIFTKTRSILSATNGNSNAAILSWVIGTVCTILGVLLVNEVAKKEIKTGGMQTYAEASWGKNFGYIVGFSETFLYVPGTLVILCYYAVQQIYSICNIDISKVSVWLTTLYIFMIMFTFVLTNMFSTSITKLFTYGSLSIKLIPLFLIIISAWFIKIDTSYVNSLSSLKHATSSASSSSVFSLAQNALVSVMFAYEGWIYIGTISQEIVDAKRNVPRALILGTGFVAVVYVLFTLASLHVIPGYIWADNNALNGSGISTSNVLQAMFGPALSKALDVAILLSILGGLNGFSIISIRLPYSLAIRKQIIGYEKLSKLSKKENLPVNSGWVMLLIASVWLILTHLFGTVFTFGKVTNSYEYYNNVMDVYMANMPVAIFWVFYCFIFAGAAKYRLEQKDVEQQGFSLPKPLVIIFAAISIYGGYLVVQSSVWSSQDGWSVDGLISLLLGVIVCLLSLIFKKILAKQESKKEITKENV